jgi:hypothetical protein
MTFPSFALALFITLTPQPSQPHPLVGVWRITYPWHLEVVNGVVHPTMEKGHLTVETRGDSLIATLEAESAGQGRSRRLATSLGTGATVFVMRDLVTVDIRGNRREATAVGTWVLRVNGDELSGSLERRIELAGSESQMSHGPQALRGTRVRS